MKKRLIFCLVLTALSVSLALADQTYVLKVKVQAANVRTEPDLNAPVIKTVTLGTLLESDGKSGDWYKIFVDDGKGNQVTGYINAKVVEIVSGEEPEPKRPAQRPVEAVPEPEPEPAPVYKRPVEYAAPRSYSSGGFRLLGGLASTNISYNKARLDEVQGEDDLAKYIKPRSSPLGGVGFEIGTRISLEFDVMYMPKGVKFEGEYDATAEGYGKVNFNADMIVNQISVPAFVKVKILRGSTPFIFAGGEVGYVLSGKLTYSYTADGKTTKGEQDLLKKDKNGEIYINRLDYGAVFGAGFELNLGGLALSIEGRYHMGMANLFKSPKTTEGTAIKDNDYIRSKAIVVLGGIKF